jgi:hypothetical protein
VITYGGKRSTHKPLKQKTTTTNKTLKQIEKEKEAHRYEISGQCTSCLCSSNYLLMLLHIITVLSFTQRQAILYTDEQDGDVTMADVDEYAGNESDWEDEVLDLILPITFITARRRGLPPKPCRWRGSPASYHGWHNFIVNLPFSSIFQYLTIIPV